MSENTNYDVVEIDGQEHIVSLKDGFTLKVISPVINETSGFWENLVSYYYGALVTDSGTLFPHYEGEIMVTGVDTEFEINNPYLRNDKQWQDAVQYYLELKYGKDNVQIAYGSAVSYEHDVFTSKEDYEEALPLYKAEAERQLKEKEVVNLLQPIYDASIFYEDTINDHLDNPTIYDAQP